MKSKIIKIPIFFLILFLKSIKGVDIEFYLDAPGVINYWGYQYERHHVQTADNYILELHRIPTGRDASSQFLINEVDDKPIIFLQHCYLCSSFDWLANQPHQSAAYIFADAGFDVWMGNFRGNTYSRNHSFLNPDYDMEFWNFSFDEHANFDLESMINYVLELRGHQSLNYVGHSLGTLTMFAKLSNDSTFSTKIKRFFALAPVGTIKRTRGVFSFLSRHFGGDIQNLSQRYGPIEFIGNSWYFKALIHYTCGLFETMEEVCSDFMSDFVGPLNNNWNQTRTPVYFAHTPAGSSLNLLTHFIQMFTYGGIPAFDYGEEANVQKYGQRYPPQYNFSKIENVPIYLLWGENDWMATEEDLNDYLFNVLNKTLVQMSLNFDNYNHLDFIWGTNAANDIYKPIIHFILNDKYS